MGNFFSDTWKDLTQPGWRQADQANATQQSAINQAAASDAFKQGQAQDLKGLATGFLFGKPANTPTINMTKGAGGTYDTSNPIYQSSLTGAQPQADQWMQDFLTNLKNSPDATFNLQKGQFENAIANQKSQTMNDMARRGLSTTGMASDAFNNVDQQRAEGLAGLMGQREATRTQNLATGAQTTQSLLDRVLNMYTGATTGIMGLNTQVPQMMQTQALMQANQPSGGGVLQGLAGTWAKGQMNNWLNPAPTQANPYISQYLTPGGLSGMASNAVTSFAKNALAGIFS
ncbi:MAG: hypothetical protein HQM09_15215 [Candidatus Riflebacteria bacterium]|nr:hypothetical protein [Candidatus Riflebacteria bacterium]